jgi:hypothetical protein
MGHPPAGLRRLATPALSPHSPAASATLGAGLAANLRHPVSLLLVQLIVIILATRGLGKLFVTLHQPAMLVLMALITTCMTGPLLWLFGWQAGSRTDHTPHPGLAR